MKFNTDTMLSNFRLYSDFIGCPNNMLCITIFWFAFLWFKIDPGLLEHLATISLLFPLMWTSFLVFHVFHDINMFEEPRAVIL